MKPLKNFKELNFLVYGLGLTGLSVINFFKKNKIKKYKVWDDNNIKLYKNKRPKNLDKALSTANYIILSPGISLKKSKSRKKLIKYRNKIITDIDLIFLQKKYFKSVVVTGTNGKSTTCKIIYHLLKNSGYKVLLGGNIGTPILHYEIKKNNFLVIEASSFQLAYSKFIQPDYALLLNISNDHLDWHGNMNNYINSKFKIFKLQKRNQYSLINEKLKNQFKKRGNKGKLIIPEKQNYKKLKLKIKNSYLSLNINDENMSYVLKLSKLLNINEKSFLKSLDSFVGLPHRYEIFLKRKNCIFINDSKATSFEATKFALKNTKNIFWIVGGLPKKNDKITLKEYKKNIIKTYIIGKNTNFFKNQLSKKINITVCKHLKSSIIRVTQDLKLYKSQINTILFSPAAASFDQFKNFEVRGNQFKKISKNYARKFI